MEKLPHQEYRDDLNTKLREIRNSNSEEIGVSEVEAKAKARARAGGFLDAKKESPEYAYNKEAHLKEIDITHAVGRGIENGESLNRKTLRELRLDYPSLDKYLRSSYKIYELLGIHLDDGYYDYENDEFVIEMVAHEDIQAYEDIVHGGVLSFLIDIGGGIASFVESIKDDRNVVTREISNVKFHRPIKVGDSIRVVGKFLGANEEGLSAETIIHKKKGTREAVAVSGLLKMKVV